MKATLTCFRLTTVTKSAALLAYLATGALALAATYEWGLSGNLDAALGSGMLEYADSQSQTLTTFGTTDGTTVPNINGHQATFMRVPAFSALGSGFNLTLSGTGPNGGGSYVNQYSFVMDLLLPGSLSWTALLNTDPNNSAGNDADFYIAPDGSVGIGSYSPVGVFRPDTWNRLAVSVNTAGDMLWYLNGAQVLTRNGGGLDGRWSLYSNADPGPDIRLFNEGDNSGQYTHEMLVNSIYVTDTALSGAQLAAFGGPNADGVLVPEPGALALLGLGGLCLALWRRQRKA